MGRYKVGAVVEELGFASTSRDKDFDQFEGDVRFTIHSKDGRMENEISSFSEEKEVLFRNNSKFFVKKR